MSEIKIRLTTNGVITIGSPVAFIGVQKIMVHPINDSCLDEMK